jgi:NarL family two-component system sensor histidine kinase LiaS
MRERSFKDFILYFLIALALYFLLAIFIVETFTTESLTAVFFERRLSYFPLVVYLFLFALLTGFLVFLYLKLSDRRKVRKIEDALKMLNEGEYSAKIFLNMFSEDTPVQINRLIDKEFLKLHEKLMLISEEAVSSAQQASTISVETREEILEEERHRIARELHDSVSQQLFAAAMLLSTLETEADELPEHLQPQVELIGNIIGDAQSEMRALLLHLRPTKLDGKSLKKGIEQLLDELKSKVPITIIHDIEDIKLTEVIEDHLFRIVQELLSNVLRHSNANELEVYLKKSENHYQLRFVDDGDGFDMEEKKSSGFGLRNIRERIAGLGGNVRIISFPDQGTSIEIRVPLITGG